MKIELKSVKQIQRAMTILVGVSLVAFFGLGYLTGASASAESDTPNEPRVLVYVYDPKADGPVGDACITGVSLPQGQGYVTSVGYEPFAAVMLAGEFNDYVFATCFGLTPS